MPKLSILVPRARIKSLSAATPTTLGACDTEITGFSIEALRRFEAVRTSGIINMIDPGVRSLAQITEEEHLAIISCTTYAELKTKYINTPNPTVTVDKKEKDDEEKDEEKEEIFFLEHLSTLIKDAQALNPVQTGLQVPNGIVDEDWLYIKDFLGGLYEDHMITFDELDQQLRPFLTIGSVKLFGSLHPERRQTAYFSLDNAIMRYTGRVLEPNAVPDHSIIARIFDFVNGSGFKMLMVAEYGLQMPHFNAVFVNKYRSVKELKAEGIEKVDALGWHADDEREHTSDTILSFTICEIAGERVFELRPKRDKSGVSRQVQLESMSCLIMLPGCQSRWKHRISDRVTRLDCGYVTGARYNLTFRSLAS